MPDTERFDVYARRLTDSRIRLMYRAIPFEQIEAAYRQLEADGYVERSTLRADPRRAELSR